MFLSTVQNLFKSRTLLLILFVSVVLLSCTKSNVRWMYYDETNCSNRWEYNINNEKLKDKVVEYLATKGIKVFEIEIFNDRTPETCNDCVCKTGRRIKCKIKKRDVNDIKKEAFY